MDTKTSNGCFILKSHNSAVGVRSPNQQIRMKKKSSRQKHISFSLLAVGFIKNTGPEIIFSITRILEFTLDNNGKQHFTFH